MQVYTLTLVTIVVKVTVVTRVTNMHDILLSYHSYRVYIGATSYSTTLAIGNRLMRLKIMSKGYYNAFT